MAFIRSISALEILDSRGNPTLEVVVTTDRDVMAKASVPSGASTGLHEACELRDSEEKRYFGKGVEQAVAHVNGTLANLLIGERVFDQEKLDRLMIQEDGTANKTKLGANAILGVSLAVCRAAALTANLPLYRYLGGTHTFLLPCPMINILNGGAHADNLLDFQEFMIRPVGAPSLKEAVRCGAEIFHTLKGLLKKEKLSTAVGDEGGFAPQLESSESALEFICEAVTKAGYALKKEVTLALDCAASEFYDKTTKRYCEKKKGKHSLPSLERTPDEHIAYLVSLCDKFPIDSIEDGMDEEDWKGWETLTSALGKRIQLVGDDVFVTNPKFLLKGIEQKVANSILIKLNQIGTVTETLETIRLAHTHGYHAIISHRSGETEDSFIADLSVAVNAGQIKTGSLSRTDRVAKYNRLLQIEHELGKTGRYLGKSPLL